MYKVIFISDKFFLNTLVEVNIKPLYCVIQKLIFELVKNKPFVKKQPPEIFFREIVLKRCPQIHGKTPVLESHFLKIFRHEACNFIKKETPKKLFFCEFCEVFKNTFFTEHFLTTSLCNSSCSFILQRIFLYICPNLLLLEKSTKIHNFAVFSFCKYIFYTLYCDRLE